MSNRIISKKQKEDAERELALRNEFLQARGPIISQRNRNSLITSDPNIYSQSTLREDGKKTIFIKN